MLRFEDISNQYFTLWQAATILPGRKTEIATAAAKLRSLQPLYVPVQAATNVPWYVVGLIHYREAGFRETGHLHNGDPLKALTVRVPAGRPLNGSPPFTWMESAIDALTMMVPQSTETDN